MNACFSSKLKKQINATFVALLLAFCLPGTHSVGLNHSIYHLGIAKQSVCDNAAVASMPTTAHSSDVCHLFDALTLAGFIPPSFSSAPLSNQIQFIGTRDEVAQVDVYSLNAYQSQAPPTFIL